MVIILDIRVVLELVRSLAHDVLNPRGELREAVSGCHHEEDAWSQHVVKVVGDESGNEFVFHFGELLCLGIKLCIDNLHVAAVHDGAIVGVYKFCFLTLELVVFVEELEELVVKRRTTDSLLCIVDFDCDVALLQNERGAHSRRP